jgi:ATP-dependent Clp protease adaptor protein ClpS
MADGMTETRERRDTGSGTGLGPPWHVVVLNDDHNTFDGVAAALAAVLPQVSFELGLRVANLIHTKGSALVWSGHREVAEHYWRGLKERGLTMAPLEQ